MGALPKLIFSDASEIRAFRKKHHMTQTEFWQRVGISQSGGSRFERERRIPPYVRLLLHLIYATDDRAERLSTALRAWRPSTDAPTPADFTALFS